MKIPIFLASLGGYLLQLMALSSVCKKTKKKSFTAMRTLQKMGEMNSVKLIE